MSNAGVAAVPERGPPTAVRRRNGTTTAFALERIRAAITAASSEAGRADSDVARAYMQYRDRRARLREAKVALGVTDELKVGLHAVEILRERYLARDAEGNVIESTGEMMDRVARHVASAEDAYRPGASRQWSDEFSGILRRLEFLPNSPTLMNAGTDLGMLSACFVLPVEDSLASIFTALRDAALVHQAGGGTGFSFSRLRPAGDRIAVTGGAASGPVPFITVFDAATNAVRQGGRRRGANMAVLDVGHPDVREFVSAKSDPGHLTNFNLSVGVTDAFMEAVQAGGSHGLVNPRTRATVADVDARDLFELIVDHAWSSGEPGLLFLDEVNRANPTPTLGRIEATNPCGEVPLLANESCTLGSVNLAKFVGEGDVDWARLSETVAVAVRFLDDVLDVNRYPTPEIEAATLRTRKIGVGVMGLAELLAELRIPYDQSGAIAVAARIAARIADEARRCSIELAEDRGAFPAFEQSVLAPAGTPRRHAQLVSIAPTGSISAIAGTTSGIEPMFAVTYVRRVLGRSMVEVNPSFERTARRRGFWSESLEAELARAGTVRHCSSVPVDVRRSYVTALEVPPRQHLRIQAAVQRHVDGAVSKTVNLPSEATREDVREVFLSAWQERLKGVTVYRYGSRPDQVLSLVAPEEEGPAVSVSREFAGGCFGRSCEY